MRGTCYNLLSMSNALNKNQIPSIQLLDAQARLGEIVAVSQTEGRPFRINNKNTTMAWLVSPQYMTELRQIVAAIIENDDAMADTLALLTNEEMNNQLKANAEAMAAGKGETLESLLA